MRSCVSPGASFHVPRRGPDRDADAIVGSATAYVAAHRAVDFRVGGPFDFGEQGRGAHDLARLAVAALRHVVLDPRGLQGLAFLGLADALDGGDTLADRGGEWRGAGSRGLAVHVHRAGAAQRHAAAVFGAGHVEVVAQNPKEGRVRIGVHRHSFAVDVQGGHLEIPREESALLLRATGRPMRSAGVSGERMRPGRRVRAGRRGPSGSLPWDRRWWSWKWPLPMPRPLPPRRWPRWSTRRPPLPLRRRHLATRRRR